MSIASVQISDPSFTVNEFCAAERMSRGMLYELWREGRGPRFYLNGKHRRITQQARLDWQRQQEAAATSLAIADGK
jgi:hypothetical protein